MAFLEDTLRQTGQPRAPAVPGAGLSPGQPAKVMNLPAVASSPVGRPSNTAPSLPGGAGAALPLSKARPTLPTSPAGRPARPSLPAGSFKSPLTGRQVLTPTAVPAPVPTLQLGRIPSRSEMMDMPPGAKIMTPYGEMGQDGTVTATPESQQAYQQAVVKKQKDFGPHPFAGDPNAPQPPARLGKPAFNPFSGTWSR